jgi:bifunctional NMN adenylyltransferase/nudix hydrolase
VVIQAGHILLIERKNSPGKGQLALPGGYLDPSDKTSWDGALRELREETRLKAPAGVLNGSRFDDQTFEHPSRSLRGRIITHAFGIHLEHLDGKGKLQEVRGADDAFEAMWVPLYKLRTIEYKSRMFEDHLSIINYFASQL